MSFVYALVDPRTDEVRYIGQTKFRQLRYKQHTQTTDKRNPIKQAWITELKEIGLLPTLIFLEEGVDWEQRFAREKYWINHYLSRGARLTNGVYTGRQNQTLQPLPVTKTLPEEEESSSDRFVRPGPANHGNSPWGFDVKEGVTRETFSKYATTKRVQTPEGDGWLVWLENLNAGVVLDGEEGYRVFKMWTVNPIG